MRVSIESGALGALLKVAIVAAKSNEAGVLRQIDPELTEKILSADLDLGTEPCQVQDGQVSDITVFNLMAELQRAVKPGGHRPKVVFEQEFAVA